MLSVNSRTDDRLVDVLRRGGVAVLRTDTLYGIVARADDEQAVERVYELKSRSDHKQPIVLISDLSQLYDRVEVDLGDKWPGPNSIILSSPSAPAWLLRGGHSLAYRMPDDLELAQLIDQTGPLIAPSANHQGMTPAHDIETAQRYFGDGVDVYVDSGQVAEDVPASKLWCLGDAGDWERLR